ncbi:MAG TPA: DUF5020 family protein [Lentimicrobium sp.]|nr:DUF5020 family protein [Lentimicrobium sp.]
MRRTLLLLSILISSIAVISQNLQLHYDLGKDRKYLTSTFEYFNPDKYGTTFLFIDFDYGAGDVKGISSAYWEVSRGLKFWKAPFAFHLEYNGGFLHIQDGDFSKTVQINDAWLTGIEYNYNNETFTRGLTLMALYKNIRDKNDVSFQLTAAWYLHYLKNKVTFSGFADFWREDNFFPKDNLISETKYVFLAEPQIWYNFLKHFSAGSEVELSNNFSGTKGFQVNPTIAVKWKIE